jgi:hypothetical protein
LMGCPRQGMSNLLGVLMTAFSAEFKVCCFSTSHSGRASFLHHRRTWDASGKAFC